MGKQWEETAEDQYASYKKWDSNRKEISQEESEKASNPIKKNDLAN
jgi:hypothetical protein